MKQLTELELVRRAQGKQLSELASDLGISQGLVSQIEGRHRRCYPSLRRKLAVALCVDEDRLFDRDGFVRKLQG